MKPTYVNIDANNQATTEPHHAVRVEHPLLASPIIVTAARSPKRMTHEQAVKWAEGLDINGWSWRLPTVEEAFLICDRTRADNVLPPEHFPDCTGEWIWTSTQTGWNSGAAASRVTEPRPATGPVARRMVVRATCFHVIDCSGLSLFQKRPDL